VTTLQIDVWSDIACPWCWVGKRRLEAALARFARRDEALVRWRAFELDPTAPRVQDAGISYAERLARKYATSLERAAAMIDTMTATAAQDGLELRFDRIRPGNTFDAHRVLHLAAERGRGDAAKERLLRAYLSEGEPIGEREVLARLAAEVGLDAAEVRAALAGDAFAREVRADEAEARALDIHAVPHFRIGGRYDLAGAQPADVLLSALQLAWDARARERSAGASGGAGAACGPAGCD
jgi:predicted DsbA family dithiol-disulfide isomerase